MQQLGINGVTYGQGGGYTGNCTTDFSGPEETNVYWYHSDHLGSTSFVTGTDGEVNQNIEYFPSGETFVENHLNSYNTPYKFNSKELDDETGYYYYGARYYNPRVSLWLNVDPLASYDPIMNSEHYIDGQHNGGVYNSGNLNPYVYTYNNPIIFIDPNGKQTYSFYLDGKKYNYTKKEVNIYAHTIVWGNDGYVRYRNSQNDQVAYRLQSNYEPMNNWTGSSEDKLTIYLRGANRPFMVSSQDVAPQYRATFVNDISAIIGAYNGDKVRALETKPLLYKLGVDITGIVAPLDKSGFTALLGYQFTLTELLSAFLVAQEKEKGTAYAALGKLRGTVVNEVLSYAIEKKFGAKAAALYNATIAPKVEEAYIKDTKNKKH